VIKNYILLFFLLLIPSNLYSESNLNNIEIQKPLIKITPNPNILSGYLLIKNTNNFEVRLISIKSKIAKKIEIHKIEIDNEVMKMIKLKDGLSVPANSVVEFKNGSYHLMFMGINKKIKTLKECEVELIFSNIGSKKVLFEISSI
tara:strand:- start:31 stop:465 length:435 start_codon:yes stop_codon:yes gene_type:complete